MAKLSTLAFAAAMAAVPATAQQSSDEKDAIHKVVTGYYDAFARDPAAAAAFYGVPTLIVLPDEVITLATRADVQGFLAKALSDLKPVGYSNSKSNDPRIKILNPTVSLYSDVTIRMKADGTELQ